MYPTMDEPMKYHYEYLCKQHVGYQLSDVKLIMCINLTHS